MKKILCYIILFSMLTCVGALPAFASESEIEETEPSFATQNDGTEALEVDATESVETIEEITQIADETKDRLDTIIAISEAMGISIEEAEALLEKMILLGDEHFGENDIWNNIRASIEQNPEAWTIVALVVLMLIALTVFIIRGLIKNTTAQAATKINIADIKKNELEISHRLDATGNKLNQIEREHSEIKYDIDEIRALASAMQEIVTACKDETDKILEMAVSMLGAVDLLKSNSEAALKVNEEQALQTVQLLNIAMGRRLPNVSDSTRRVWYEDAVNKIKIAAKDIAAEDKNEK